jgi:hypothetical protein
MTTILISLKALLIPKNQWPFVVFFGLLVPEAWAPPMHAQLSENTNNVSRGSSNTFTITINSTHGIQTNASRTPDFAVETYGNMVVAPDSTSIQENKDGASGYMKTGGGEGIGQSVGVSGMQRINFGEGTRYEVKIIPKTEAEMCPAGTTGCTLPEIGNANGSAVGTTSTSITVNSTESSFVNTFIRSFSAD